MQSSNNIFQSVMKYDKIVILLISVLFLFGLIALLIMPRQEFPNFTIRQGLVVGVYPGASASQVEEQLTKKVESFLFGYSEIKRAKTYSTSSENAMIIVVELNDEVSDSDAFWTKLRHGLNELKSQLPPEVISLTGSNDFGKTANILLALEAEGKSYRQMRDYMEQIEEELRKLPSVSKLKRFGEVPEQIGIYIRDEKLVHYGIRPLTVLAALKSESGLSYSGDVDNGFISMPVHAPSRYHSEQDIAEQIVYADPAGHIVRLKDVARVVREYKTPDSYIESDGNQALLLSLEMRQGENIVMFGKDVDQAMARVKSKLPPQVKLHKIADMPQAVSSSIMVFLKELLIAVIAVIIVTVLLLPFRVASVAAVTIPITIIIALGFLFVLGIDLQTVSLAGLIIVLGMVVDNSIVIIDSHVDKLDHGLSPWDAAWTSARELFMPVLTACLVIISTWLPMTFWLKGVGRDFVFSLPVTIGTTIGISILIAGFFVPILCYRQIKSGVQRKQPDEGKKTFLALLQNGYERLLTFSLHFPKKTVLIGLLTVALGAVISIGLPRQVFPKIDRNQFAVEIYLPDGQSLQETARVARSVAATLKQDPEVRHVTAFIGDSSPRFHDLYAPNFPGKNYAQLIVNTVSNQATLNLIERYAFSLADRFPSAYVRMRQLEISNTPAALELRIRGENIADLKATARQVTAIMSSDPDINWVRNDFGHQVPGLRLDIREDEANRLGLSKGLIANSVMIGLEGLPLTTVWENDVPIDVLVRRENPLHGGISEITDQYVSSPILPVSVPVRQVVHVSEDWDEGKIIRRNGIRTLTVRADVVRTRLAADVLDRIRPEIKRLTLPQGVAIEFGGDQEAEIENYIPLSYSLLTSVVVIFFILLFRFKRIRLALLIMCVMPLGVLGAALGLLIVGYQFGFTAFAGVICLFGEVVRNGIILIDYAEQLRKTTTMSALEIALAAGKRRMRPVFLTASAAAVGVMPMVFGGSNLWGPMGSVICFGLIVSTCLTLFVLPAGYLLLNPKKDQSAQEVPA